MSCFHVWQGFPLLKFTRNEKSTSANVDIKFVSGDHQDGEPSDGKGKCNYTSK